MDDRTFDDLAKVVGSGTQRRTVLKTIAGGALGVVLASVGAGETLASTRKRGFGNVCAKDSNYLTRRAGTKRLRLRQRLGRVWQCLSSGARATVRDRQRLLL